MRTIFMTRKDLEFCFTLQYYADWNILHHSQLEIPTLVLGNMTMVFRFLVFAASIFGVFLIIVLSLWHDGVSAVLNNADLIQPFLVTEDLLRYTDTYHGWRHSPAPYIFPDWFLAGILVLVPVSPIWKTALYAAVSLAGFALAAGWIVKEATGTRYVKAVLIFSLSLIALLLGSGLLHHDFRSKWYFLTVAAPFIHNGATFGMLLATALMGRLWNKSGKLWLVALLLLVVFMSAYSDLLFVVWFVAPAIAVYVYRGFLTRSAGPFLMAFGIGATTVLAVLIKRTLHREKTVRSVHSDEIAEAAKVFFQSVKSYFVAADVPMMALLFGLVCICVAGVGVFVLTARSKNMPFSQALQLLLAGTIVCGFLVPVLSGRFDDPSHWRYLIVMPIVALLAVSCLVAKRLIGPSVRTALPALATVALAILMAVPAYRVATAFKPVGDLEVCLRAEGLTTGYGEYWTAKALIFHSERRIHLVQLTGGAGRYEHNYNRVWFKRRSDGRDLGTPNFVIMTGIKPDEVMKRLGPPSDKLQCDNHEIWRYSELSGPGACLTDGDRTPEPSSC